MSMFLYPNRAKQLIDFTSLCWGKVHPTDIDGVMEFGGKKLVLMELKTKGKEADKGQKIALEHLADNWKSTAQGRDAIVIYAEHTQYDTDKPVDMGMAIVKEVYHDKKYYTHYQEVNRTVRSVIWAFAHEEIQARMGDEECSQLKP